MPLPLPLPLLLRLPLPLPLLAGGGVWGSGFIARDTTNAGGGGATGGGEALTGALGAGVIFRIGGTEAGGGLVWAAEMARPSPFPLNGPAMSSGRLMCFWAGFRISEWELNRESTSLRGSTTGSESYSSLTLNRVGAAWRNSPKVILTTPNASCGMIFPTEIEMLARLKSAPGSANRSRSCGGRPSRTDGRGNSRSGTPSTGDGTGAGAGFGRGGVNC